MRESGHRRVTCGSMGAQYPDVDFRNLLPIDSFSSAVYFITSLCGARKIKQRLVTIVSFTKMINDCYASGGTWSQDYQGSWICSNSF